MAGNSGRFLRYDAFLPRSCGAIWRICADLTHFEPVSGGSQRSENSEEKYLSTGTGEAAPSRSQLNGLRWYFLPGSGADSRCCATDTGRKMGCDRVAFLERAADRQVHARS